MPIPAIEPVLEVNRDDVAAEAYRLSLTRVGTPDPIGDWFDAEAAVRQRMEERRIRLAEAAHRVLNPPPEAGGMEARPVSAGARAAAVRAKAAKIKAAAAKAVAPKAKTQKSKTPKAKAPKSKPAKQKPALAPKRTPKKSGTRSSKK